MLHFLRDCPDCNVLVAGIASHDNCTFGPPNGRLNSNDSRMLQVIYANGLVWGALDTGITVGGQNRAGIAYFGINPNSRAASKKMAVIGRDLRAYVPRGEFNIYLFSITFRMRSNAQSTSSRLMTSGGAIRITWSCVSLQRIPSCFRASQ